MSEQEEKIKSLEILVTSTRSKIDYLFNADNALDSKAGVMIALVFAIVLFYVGNVSYFCGFSLIPLVLFGLSTYNLWSVLRVKTYNTGVVDFYNNPKDYRSMKPDILLEQLLSDYQESYDTNSKHLEYKNKDYKQALNLFLIGFILLIFFI